MDKKEALEVAEKKLKELRGQSYEELKEFLSPEGATSLEVTGNSGNKYQLEIQSMWDNKKDGDLRIMVSVDDFSLLRTMLPLTTGFIIAPDGTFVDE